jgi:hypothetical protein
VLPVRDSTSDYERLLLAPPELCKSSAGEGLRQELVAFFWARMTVQYQDVNSVE